MNRLRRRDSPSPGPFAYGDPYDYSDAGSMDGFDVDGLEDEAAPAQPSAPGPSVAERIHSEPLTSLKTGEPLLTG